MNISFIGSHLPSVTTLLSRTTLCHMSSIGRSYRWFSFIGKGAPQDINPTDEIFSKHVLKNIREDPTGRNLLKSHSISTEIRNQVQQTTQYEVQAFKTAIAKKINLVEKKTIRSIESQKEKTIKEFNGLRKELGIYTKHK